MSDRVTSFGKTATGLSKNPLGIIALFIVLVYGFASLVVGFHSKFESSEKLPLIWFLVLFPIIVLFVFGWLVSKHHKKLYGPGDFKDERNFVETYNPKLKKLGYIRPNPVEVEPSSEEQSEEKKVPKEEVAKKDIDMSLPTSRELHRNDIYSKNRGFNLVHVVEPSSKSDQEYDIFIYILGHKGKKYSDIKKTEFFFGSYWGNEIFEGTRIGDLIGVTTSAYGEFLCTCRVLFKDGKETFLERYIDFEMGKTILKNE